jgi:hypothetical protein
MNIPILRPSESLPPDVPFAYVTARGGHYLLKRGPFFEACVQVPENSTLEEVKESYRFTGPKIPSLLFSKILGFFEAVRLKHKTEAAVLLAFENGCWDVLVPEQAVTGASVKYKISTGRRIAGSCHSHPGFSASFSRTDEKDEADFDGIHIVVADSGFVRPEVSVAAVVSGRRIELDVEDIVEGFDNQSDFPPEWLGRVTPERGQNVLFHEEPGPNADVERALNPLCCSCVNIAGCDLEPPDPAEFCHFFEPSGSRGEGP